MLRLLIVGILALSLPLAAHAGATAQGLKGDVQSDGVSLIEGQRMAAPTAISTGPGGQVTLRFEDGMQIVLSENSLLRIVDFRYSESGVADRGVIDLLRGAARVVTGKVALNSPKQFFFRTPQTQLTIDKPSDFMVAVVNPAYVIVNSGSVIASNGWGATTLGPGSTSLIATSAAAPTTVAAGSLPLSASSAMTNLSLAAVSAPAGTAAVGVAATAGGVGTAFVTPVVIGAAVVAGVAAAANNSDGSSSTSTTTHH